VIIMLIHPGERILPELSESLALYAQEKLAARGVSVRIRTRVVDAAPGTVTTDHDTIPARTVIWTAGNMPHPLLKTLGIELNQRGAAITDDKLLVKGQTTVWAIGDCAQVPDVITGKAAPPTAQFATRQAKTLACNIHAAMNGQPLKQFRFKPLGALAVLGHRTATAEIRGLKFSGLLAWLMWRGIYLVKLPGLEKRVRVLLDWIVDIFFPRDLVYYQFPVQKPLADEPAKDGGAS
jgi:NADH dehydrogenase